MVLPAPRSHESEAAGLGLPPRQAARMVKVKIRPVRKAIRFCTVSPLFIASACCTQSQHTDTYVSQFQVPRANWAQYSDDTEKTFIPVAEKLMADGTILGWSTFETLVHTP